MPVKEKEIMKIQTKDLRYFKQRLNQLLSYRMYDFKV